MLAGILFNSLNVEVPKTVVKWILGFNQFKDGPYHDVSRVKRDVNNEELSDTIEYHYIQLPKFLEQVNEIKTREEQWLAYLSCSLNKDELKELFKMNRSIEEINKIVDIVMTDDDVMDALNARILAEKDGEKENKIEIAKKMLAKGMSDEEIVELTGITDEDLAELK